MTEQELAMLEAAEAPLQAAEPNETAAAIDRLTTMLETGLTTLAEALAAKQAAIEQFRLGKPAASKYGEIARIFGNED